MTRTSTKKQISILVLLFLAVLSSCKKDLKTKENTPNYINYGFNRTYSFVQDSFLIPVFIDSINVVFQRQSSNQEISIDSALDLMEASINYSLSDLDSALKNHDTVSYGISFNILPNSNFKFDFIDVANETKSIVNNIRSVCTGTYLRLNVCRIDKINEQAGQFRVVIDIGEIDLNFNFQTIPDPPTVIGNHLWRNDEYEFYSYINCEVSKPYAPSVLNNQINQYLRDVTTFRLKDIALAAPFGYRVYYDNWEFVDIGGKQVFDYTDFINLSKLDWPNSILSFADHVSCGGKQDEPIRAPIYAADPSKVACFVLFEPTIFGHKSCINTIGMNYYISKSLNIWDVLMPTTLSNMFHSMNVSYVEPVSLEDPIRHLYFFRTVRARTRPDNASIL